MTARRRWPIAALFACAFALLAALLWGRAAAAGSLASESSSWSSIARGEVPTCEASTDREGPARALTSALDDDDDQDDDANDGAARSFAASSSAAHLRLGKPLARATIFARNAPARRPRAAQCDPAAPRGPPSSRTI